MIHRLVAFALALGLLSSCDAPATGSAPRVAARPLLIAAPVQPSDVASIVASELAKARAGQATLVVYIGATWCEPCQRFHDALTAGELDSALPDVRFLEFDYDKSRDALAKAGYVSQMIPLFAIPKEDGSASAQRIEGSIKGPTAVAQNLVPRLQTLLQGAVRH